MGTQELLIAAWLIMAVGLVGTVVPGLPGMPLVLGGVLVFAFGTGFREIAPLAVVGMMVIGLTGVALNYLGSVLGARRFGASWQGLLGALAGLIIGLFALGPFGVVVGPLLGAVAVELARGRPTSEAVRGGIGVIVGYLLGSLVEVVTALIVVGWFVWSTIGLLGGGSRV